MSQRPSLRDFVDDELMRAPMTFDLVVDAVHQHWRTTLPVASRLENDPARVLARCRGDLVNEAVLQLRRLIQLPAEASRLGGPPGGRERPELSLSLIDEDAVSADIEITRTSDLIKSSAEYELRELQAYTSALVDDVNVSRETNPFRPECYARALWSAVQTLPLSRSLQVGFMHEAAEPMARLLRKVYAAACTRLESQGVEPAAYRTIVHVQASRVHLPPPKVHHGHLSELRDSVPMPLYDAGIEVPELTARPRSAAAPTAPSVAIAAPGPVREPAPHTKAPDAVPATTAASPVDQQLIELVTRLFDAVQADPLLRPGTLALVQRLQPRAIRVALHDPALLEAYDHPVWTFIDTLARVLDATPPTDRPRCEAACRQLVDHLVADGDASGERFVQAARRLELIDRKLLDSAVDQARPHIERLKAATPEGELPIDVGSLDTVPAELMPLDTPSPSPAVALPEPAAGERLHAYLQGEWRQLRVLWCPPGGDDWLLQDIATGEHWAVRRRALERLAAEQLVRAWQPRSIVRGAAAQVLQALDGTGVSV